MKFSKDQKIAIIGIIIMILVAINWSHVQDIILNRKPDTYVFIYKYDKSYSPKEIETMFPSGCVKQRLRYISAPSGYGGGINYNIPMIEWKYSDKEDLIQIVIQNRGNKISKNVSLELKFEKPPMNPIKDIEIQNKNRIEIINGGINSSLLTVSIKELVPNEAQVVGVVYSGNGLDNTALWVENENIDINKKIFIFEVYFENC